MLKEVRNLVFTPNPNHPIRPCPLPLGVVSHSTHRFHARFFCFCQHRGPRRRDSTGGEGRCTGGHRRDTGGGGVGWGGDALAGGGTGGIVRCGDRWDGCGKE